MVRHRTQFVSFVAVPMGRLASLSLTSFCARFGASSLRPTTAGPGWSSQFLTHPAKVWSFSSCDVANDVGLFMPTLKAVQQSVEASARCSMARKAAACGVRTRELEPCTCTQKKRFSVNCSQAQGSVAQGSGAEKPRGQRAEQGAQASRRARGPRGAQRTQEAQGPQEPRNPRGPRAECAETRGTEAAGPPKGTEFTEPYGPERRGPEAQRPKAPGIHEPNGSSMSVEASADGFQKGKTGKPHQRSA